MISFNGASRPSGKGEATAAQPLPVMATLSTIDARLRRHSSSCYRQLDWHLRRHPPLSARLAAADVDEVAIDTESLTPFETASAVLVQFG